MNQYSVLGHHVIPSEKFLIGCGFIVLHSSDPKHTTNAVKAHTVSHELGSSEPGPQHQ